MENPNSPPPRQRLGSWKEIATFFGRDERTVRRWEKQRGMPVHRLPGGERGGVFAFTDQLSEWQRTRNFPESDSQAATQPEDLPSDVSPAAMASGEEMAGIAPMDSVQEGIAQAMANAVSPAHSSSGLFGLPGFSMKAGIVFVAAVLTLIIAAAVVEQRFHEAGHSLVSAAPSMRKADPEAADLYLKGRFYWNKRTPDDLNKAAGYFTQAIVRDPGYACAYVGLADCYNLLGEYTALPPGETHARAYAAAKKAVELDDSSAEAHTTLAFATLYWKWDQAASEREFQRAIALDPNDSQAHHWYATSLVVFGRLPEALTQINLAQSLDPSSRAILADKGVITYHAGHHDEGLAALKQLASSDPSYPSPHRYLADIYLDAKDYPNYLAERKKVALLINDHRELAVVNEAEKGLSQDGFRAMLESMLPLQQRFYSQGATPAYSLATTFALLGKKEESLQYLQVAYDQRESRFLLLRTDHAFDSMRGDAAFEQLQALVTVPRPD